MKGRAALCRTNRIDEDLTGDQVQKGREFRGWLVTVSCPVELEEGLLREILDISVNAVPGKKVQNGFFVFADEGRKGVQIILGGALHQDDVFFCGVIGRLGFHERKRMAKLSDRRFRPFGGKGVPAR